MRRLISDYQLCPKLCFMQTDNDTCVGLTEETCLGACEHQEDPSAYNKRVQEALDYLEEMLPTFAVVGEGNQVADQSCILVEKGRFYGMGYIPADSSITNVDALKDHLTRYPENDYIRGIIYQYVERNPHKKLAFD